jgi:hypothetical protein
MAGVALVAAVDAVLCLNGSFGHRRGTAPDPFRSVGEITINVWYSVKAAVQIAKSLKSAPKATNSSTRIRCVAIANILRNTTISVDKFYIYTYTTPH